MQYVAILLADGFEEVEALLPCDFLRRAGIETKLISVMSETQVSGSHGIKVLCDDLLENVMASHLVALVIPGGMPGASTLADDTRVIELLNDVYAKGIMVAAVCASPAVVLTRTNFFSDKKFTCTPVCRDKLTDKGNYVEAPVVIDGNIITSRGPGTTAHFAHAIISDLMSKEKADEIFSDALFHLHC
jgi:protein deglycase